MDTVTSSMGNDLSTRQVNDLPLFGRVYSQLVQIMPGAVKTGIGSSAESGSGIGANGSITAAVNGIVYQGTTFTLDGVSDMELENAFQNVTPPMDDIAEVKVSGNNASADVGTYGGAQVNAMIKSGTNQLHGSAFEFYRRPVAQRQHLGQRPHRRGQSPVPAPISMAVRWAAPSRRTGSSSSAATRGSQLNNGVTYTYTVPTPMLANGYFPTNYFTKPIYDPLTGSSAAPGPTRRRSRLSRCRTAPTAARAPAPPRRRVARLIRSPEPVGPGGGEDAGRQHHLARRRTPPTPTPRPTTSARA